jgi:hypothetical protein
LIKRGSTIDLQRLRCRGWFLRHTPYTYIHAGFDIITAVIVRSTISWDVTPRGSERSLTLWRNYVASIFRVEEYRRVRLFDPEDGDVFLRNVYPSPNNTAVQSRRPSYSAIIVVF